MIAELCIYDRTWAIRVPSDPSWKAIRACDCARVLVRARVRVRARGCVIGPPLHLLVPSCTSAPPPRACARARARAHTRDLSLFPSARSILSSRVRVCDPSLRSHTRSLPVCLRPCPPVTRSRAVSVSVCSSRPIHPSPPSYPNIYQILSASRVRIFSWSCSSRPIHPSPNARPIHPSPNAHIGYPATDHGHQSLSVPP